MITKMKQLEVARALVQAIHMAWEIEIPGWMNRGEVGDAPASPRTFQAYNRHNGRDCGYIRVSAEGERIPPASGETWAI